MITAERYLTLYGRFGGDRSRGLPVEATLEELSEALFCTTRNAKLILRRLEEEGLIDWLPGRGRGNRSRIAFKTDKETFLLELSQNRAEKGDYKQAFELLQSFGEGTLAKPKFLEWLNGQFGYRKEEARDGISASDTLRFPVYRPVTTFDPAHVNYAFDAHLVRQIYGRLLQFDDAAGKIAPSIAHYWTSNPEATEWTFYLRKGVRFHDGQELTTEDVAFTLERLRGEMHNRWLLRGVQQIEVLGPRVLRIHLNRPNRIFDRYMCSCAASILPANLGGMEETEFWRLPIGTGPFRIVSQSPHCIELAAHATYHEGRPYLDGVDVIIMPEDCLQTAVGMPEVLHHEFAENHPLEKHKENWQTIKQLCRGCTLLTWNLRRPGAHQSEAFRRAVRMILNTRDLVSELGGDRVMPAFGFRPEASQSRSVEPFRPERVKTALRESHYDGSVIRFTAHEKFREDAHWIVERLGQWGIHIEMKILTWAEAPGCGSPVHDEDLLIHGFVLAEDEVCEIEAYEHGDSVFKEYLDDELLDWINGRIDDALSADTVVCRRQHLKVIEEHLRDEASVIFLHHKELRTSLHPSIRGVSLNTLGWIDFKDIWLEKLV
ncbi:ABC transporter substrate-binding protein [Paenibacillus albidus]|uniref:ABC transporter substrate-binding protein n=1 Tax=Paenibacillus albidus TaxID=2041023 RepID=A0A917FME1_9BACL|nr:SgrR family transcriptional regulator [Paenibacillus albidus]GGF91343.1 ABC transporter substrate-binding protein [Paenibacillus albidus]